MSEIADWNSDSVTQELLVYRYLNGWNYSIEYGAIEDGVYGSGIIKNSSLKKLSVEGESSFIGTDDQLIWVRCCMWCIRYRTCSSKASHIKYKVLFKIF